MGPYTTKGVHFFVFLNRDLPVANGRLSRRVLRDMKRLRDPILFCGLVCFLDLIGMIYLPQFLRATQRYMNVATKDIWSIETMHKIFSENLV
mmetsp:Transcript_25905/g.54020  ORF Transcript_25905/g.54020 Transcript_25905/m.54020 type:complete len:92 (+) Transcript_25905:644-919(+)